MAAQACCRSSLSSPLAWLKVYTLKPSRSPANMQVTALCDSQGARPKADHTVTGMTVDAVTCVCHSQEGDCTGEAAEWRTSHDARLVVSIPVAFPYHPPVCRKAQPPTVATESA